LKEHSFKDGSSVLPKILTNFLTDKIFRDLKKGKNGAKGMSLKDAAHTITTRKKCRDPEINWKGD
jgi:hypothetical protein